MHCVPSRSNRNRRRRRRREKEVEGGEVVPLYLLVII
jgi:hypothetical protein